MKANLFSTTVFLTAASFAMSPLAIADNITYDTSLASPGFYNGTGNPNSGFTVDTVGNLELGLGAIVRFVGPITPNPTNSNVYFASPGTSGGAALWDWEFSINTQAGGGTNTLSEFGYVLTILDVGTNTINSFDPSIIPDNSYYGPGGKTTNTPPSGAFGMQNAENNSFTGFLPGFNPNANDTYDYTLQAFHGDTLIATDSIQVVVGSGASVPEPKQTVLLSLMLACVSFFAWRKHRSVA